MTELINALTDPVGAYTDTLYYLLDLITTSVDAVFLLVALGLSLALNAILLDALFNEHRRMQLINGINTHLGKDSSVETETNDQVTNTGVNE